MADRNAEADRVELVYYWAVNQLGTALAIDVSHLYETEMPLNPKPTANGWLTKILQLMFGFRKEASDLAVAYYRLIRALRTGSTIATEGETPGESVSLEELRNDFEDIVDNIDAETGGNPPPRNLHAVDDADIPLESGDVASVVDESEKALTREALDNLDQLGLQNLLNDIENGRDPEEAWTTARDRTAASAARITMNAARGVAYNLASTDAKIKGWVRYSSTGTPCGWCAMLISRGFTERSGLYRTAYEAQHKGRNQDENKYHDNCRCITVPIFFEAQLQSDIFKQNREYAALWPKVTQGYGGKEALRIWRAYFRNLNKQSAQAAA